MGVLSKIVTFARVYNLYKDWWMFVLYYLGYKKNKEISLNLRNGIKFNLINDSHSKGVINESWIFNISTYDKEVKVENKDTVIDIGGHIGTFTIFAALKNKEGKIFVFEPSKKNFRLLKKNIKQNKIGNVYIERVGIGAKRGKIRLYFGEHSGAHSLYGKGKYEEVKIITLEDVFKKYKIRKCDFLKMDCEGCEFEVLYNLKNSFFKKIDKITMECHESLFKGEKGKTVKEMEKFLRKKGYKVSHKDSRIYAKRTK